VVTRLGHQAASVQNLSKGLDATLSGKINIVFLDILMPDGNGLDILPKVHAAPSPFRFILLSLLYDVLFGRIDSC